RREVSQPFGCRQRGESNANRIHAPRDGSVAERGGRRRSDPLDGSNENAVPQMRLEQREVTAAVHCVSPFTGVTETTLPFATYRSVVSENGVPAFTTRPRYRQPSCARSAPIRSRMSTA